jgi:hypothetical protein
MLHPFPVIWITALAGCRCILCYCRDTSTLHPFPVIWIKAAATIHAYYVSADASTLHPFPVIWIKAAATIHAYFVAADASMLHPFPVIKITSVADFRCIFMLLQMHQRCIPSPRSGSQLQHTADAFYVAADASTLHPFPVIWITAAAGFRCILCCC